MSEPAHVGRSGARAHGALLFVACVALAAPQLLLRHPPYTDLPEHVAAIGSLRRILLGVAGEPYALAAGSSQYFAYHLGGALISLVVGDAVRANQVLLALVAVGWPLSLRALLLAARRDPRAAVLGAPLFFSRALAIGFLPYLASVPVALFALAALLRLDEAPSARRGAALAAVALALFYVHVSTFVLFVGASGAFVAVRALEPHRALADLPRAARAVLARCASRLAWLAPSAVAALLWVRTGSLARGRALPGDQDLIRMPIERSVHALPLWALDMWPAHGDELAGVLFWLAFALVVLLVRRPVAEAASAAPARGPSWIALACPAVVAAILALATPWAVGPAVLLNVRLAPLVVLLVLVPLPFARVRPALAPAALATLATIVAATTTVQEARALERQEVGDVDALLAPLPEGARLATLQFGLEPPGSYFPSYLYVGSYHRALRGGIASWGFAELPHWPLHYARDSAAPPRHGRFWIFRPCAYRYEVDGAFYDAVLVRDRRDVFDGAPGPRFEEVARQGRYTLYRKAADDAPPARPAPDEPAAARPATPAGPCEDPNATGDGAAAYAP